MNPLSSVRGAITAGVILAILVMIIVAALGLSPGSFYELGLARWLHILSADHDSGGVRAVVLHNDEDLAPCFDLACRRLVLHLG